MLRQNLPLKSSPVAAAVWVARTTDWCWSLSVLESHFSTSSQLNYCEKLLHQKSCQRWRTTQTTELLLRTDVLVLSGVIRMHFWVIIYDSGGRQQATRVCCPLPSLVNTVTLTEAAIYLSDFKVSVKNMNLRSAEFYSEQQIRRGRWRESNLTSPKLPRVWGEPLNPAAVWRTLYHHCGGSSSVRHAQ